MQITAEKTWKESAKAFYTYFLFFSIQIFLLSLLLLLVVVVVFFHKATVFFPRTFLEHFPTSLLSFDRPERRRRSVIPTRSDVFFWLVIRSHQATRWGFWGSLGCFISGTMPLIMSLMGVAVCYVNARRCFLLLLLPHFFDAQRMKRTMRERCGDMQKLPLEWLSPNVFIYWFFSEFSLLTAVLIHPPPWIRVGRKNNNWQNQQTIVIWD